MVYEGITNPFPPSYVCTIINYYFSIPSTVSIPRPLTVDFINLIDDICFRTDSYLINLFARFKQINILI